MNYKAFTLIEILIVISIIAILSLVSLRLNWWQIGEMEAMNEREQRLAWHRKQNNLITNTNYIQGKKISEVTFQYSQTGITMISSWGQEYFPFHKQTLSWDTILTKQTLSLWCTATNTTIELIGKTKNTCFTLNTRLCSRTPCTSSN